jgi:hypothetical protein
MWTFFEDGVGAVVCEDVVGAVCDDGVLGGVGVGEGVGAAPVCPRAEAATASIEPKIAQTASRRVPPVRIVAPSPGPADPILVDGRIRMRHRNLSDRLSRCDTGFEVTRLHQGRIEFRRAPFDDTLGEAELVLMQEET